MSSTQTIPATRVSTRSSTDYLDGLRGCLICMVLLLHIYYLAGRGFYVKNHLRLPLPWYLETFRWYYPGLFTVGLFVVVSGYCLMLPVARSNDRRMTGGILDYMRRRARRIIPPYYIAATLSLVHVWFLRSEYMTWANPLTRFNLISHALVFYNFTFATRFQLNGPYWSLAPEWQLYLLFPIVLVPVWRKFDTAGLLIGSALTTVALMFASANLRDMHPWFLFLFTVGMFTAVVTEAKTGALATLRERAPWAGIACGLFAAFAVEWVVVWFEFPQVFGRQIAVWETYSLNETLLGLATCASIVHWTKVRRVKPMAEWPLVLRFLHHKNVMLLGRFSYSHYLVHYPILVTTTSLIIGLHLPILQTMVVSYIVCIPASLGLSYLFFLAVEKHFLPKRMAKLEHVPVAR